MPNFLFLAANTPWVYALARALSEHGSVTSIRFFDWTNYRRLKPQWPEDISSMRRLTVNLPPGYAGRLELFFRPLLRSTIARERERLRFRTGTDPIVVCPYPFLAPWVRDVPGRSLVYYNLDDYALYDPSRAARTARLEGELVSRARASLCLSVHQVEVLRSRHPYAASRITHFPLGVVHDFINPEPDRAPLPQTVGYVGNLTNRVHWSFVESVAALMPQTRFHFVGRLDDLETGADVAGWKTARARALDLKNVVYEGALPQAQVREHYWRYAVNWMPYAMDHPFNISSCPTKIMDALASGRPFLATDIPEVRLYPDRIHVVRTAQEAATGLRRLLASASFPNATEQVTFAAANTWEVRGNQFIGWLTSTEAEKAC